MAHGNNIEDFYNYTRINPTWFEGADFGVRNVGDHPRDYFGSSRNFVPRSGIQENMWRGGLQQSEPGPHGPPKFTQEDFKQLNVLGIGAFGNVMLVRKTKGEHKNKLFAMKVSKKPRGYRFAKREKEALMKCKHPFIVSLFCTFQTESKFCLILEYVAGGDFMTYIKRNYSVPEEHARFYSSEIILAIEYLHGLSIVYRDLKPDNVLICADGHIKLADFGLCKQLEHSSTYSICGTKGFMAPEMLIDEPSRRPIYGKAVDWWSMGALMYQMLLGQRPFQRVADHEYLHHVMTVHLKDDWPFASRLSVEAKDLITQLLAVNACARLGGGPDDAVPIKGHKFFISINWDDVLQKKYKPPYKANLKSETDTSAFDPKFRGQIFDDDTNVKACDYNFEGFSYVVPSSFDGFPEESGSCQGQQPRPAQVPSRSINHCPTDVIHQIQVVGDHTARSPRFDAHQQAKSYPAMSNTPQILHSYLSYNPPISDPVKESHRQRYFRMDYTTVTPMFGHHNLVPPPPGFNMAQNPPPDYYNASTRGPIPEPVKVIHDTRDMAWDWFSSLSTDPYVRLLTCQNPAFIVPPPLEVPPCYLDNCHQFSGPTNICLPPGNVIQNMAGVGRLTLSNGAHVNVGMPARFNSVPNMASFGHPTLPNHQYMDTGMSAGNVVPNMAGNGFASLPNGANINTSMPTGYFLPNMNGNGHPAIQIGPYTTNNLHINFNMSGNAGIGPQNFPNGQQINTGVPAGNVISNKAWNGVSAFPNVPQIPYGMPAGNVIPNMAGNGLSLPNGPHYNMAIPGGNVFPNLSGNDHPTYLNVPHINNGTVINMLTGNTSQNMQGIGFFASQPAPHINIGVPAGGGLHPHPNMMGIDPRSSPDCRHLFKDSSADNLIPKLARISIKEGQNDPQNQPGAQYIHHPCPQKTHVGQLPLSGMATDLCLRRT